MCDGHRLDMRRAARDSATRGHLCLTTHGRPDPVPRHYGPKAHHPHPTLTRPRPLLPPIVAFLSALGLMSLRAILMSNAALAFDPGRCTSVAKCGAKASTPHRAFWVRVKFPSKGYAAIAIECRVTLSGKQLGRVLKPAIAEYEAWLQGKVVESAARAAVQLSPCSRACGPHTPAGPDGRPRHCRRGVPARLLDA